MVHQLEVELAELKKEMSEMKSFINLKLEDEFINIKSQLSEIMNKLSKQGEDIINIKTLVATRECTSSERTPKEGLKTKQIISSVQENSHNNNNQCNCQIEIKSQTSLPEVEKEIRQLSFKLCEQEKCINKMKLACNTDFILEKISKMHNQYSVMNKKTHIQFKKLEKLFNLNLKNERKPFYEALKSIKEKIDENKCEIDQCLIKIDNLEDKEALNLDLRLKVLSDGIQTEAEKTEAPKKKRLKLEYLNASVDDFQELYLDSESLKSFHETNETNVAASDPCTSTTMQSTCGNMVGKISLPGALEDKSFEELRWEYCLRLRRKFPLVKSATVPYQATPGEDIMIRHGVTTLYQTSLHCITIMKEYKHCSVEELRWNDYKELECQV
ncbi:uncharacterized protein LOC131946049 [Physella acuta]|uniref:uncharacterized protein LOC131946049 n=1 Tax=Physella acuta TaxID=109671 RepID=UPI0027DAC730|nr:uncharacterized protein LOC131946049 [Physella acuta]